jgi:hypothetical protein
MLLKIKSGIIFAPLEMKEEFIMEAKKKHYIYISDIRVDMLYAQIDKSLRAFPNSKKNSAAGLPRGKRAVRQPL